MSAAKLVSVTTSSAIDAKDENGNYTVEGLIAICDYVGALELVSAKLALAEDPAIIKELLQWKGYCAFSIGNYDQAEKIYCRLIDEFSMTDEVHLYRAMCLFHQKKYIEAEAEVILAPEGPISNRILFHIAQRRNDEDKVLKFHQKLNDVYEDQLSLASIHYFRGNYQEVIFYLRLNDTRIITVFLSVGIRYLQKVLFGESGASCVEIVVCSMLFQIGFFRCSN